MKINELRPFSKKVELTVKVVEKAEAKEVSSKIDGSTHRVAEATVGDDTGTILVTLWDDTIDKLETGKSYQISNGYTSLFKNTLRLNIGRYGTLADAPEEVATVNTENNMSAKEFEQRRRFGGGGGRFGGGGGRFGGGGRYGGGHRDRGSDEGSGDNSY